MKSRTILCYPRSASKLLALVHQQYAGYHSFGEFFNTISCEIKTINSMPVAVRTPIQQQQLIKTKYRTNKYDTLVEHSTRVRRRITLYNDASQTLDKPSIVTLFFTVLNYAPELYDIMTNTQVLCLRRKNKLEQLLSRCITSANSNHDDEIASKPIQIDLPFFRKYYYDLYQTEKLQQVLVDKNIGFYVDFDDLISGKAELGFNYEVTTKDQHVTTSLYDLVQNIDEVVSLFNLLEHAYKNKEDNNVL